MIEIEGLTRAFGGIKAVDDLSFKATDGQVTGLIGPNGAGKTTTFRMLIGLLEADCGSARVDGFDVATELLDAKRRLGILPDVRGLYPRLTAREHLRYYGRLCGLAGGLLESRISELAARLDMTDFIDRRARGFSRGQELKVALGRALIHRPHNLVLDEPTNGLDVHASRAVHGLIREMRDAGHAIIISSHVMTEVAALCDHIVVMVAGRKIIEGTADELRRRTGADNLEDMFVAVVARAGIAA